VAKILTTRQLSVIGALDCPIVGTLLNAPDIKGEPRSNDDVADEQGDSIGPPHPNQKGIVVSSPQNVFPQDFRICGGDSYGDDTPISCLYTLDPRAVFLIEGVGVVPIDRIDETGQRHNRAKSLILRHHETLSKALGYVDGIEDLMNTPDRAQLYMTRAGIFTLMQRPTQCEWPSPMIFYIAEACDEDTRRFEVAVGSDGKARATDWLGND
jgi:hypothetical protein